MTIFDFLYFGMNNRLLFQWIPLLCIVLLIITGIFLKQKNAQLIKKNSLLILQNDSILSVNIVLGKNILRMQQTLDSLATLRVQNVVH